MLTWGPLQQGWHQAERALLLEVWAYALFAGRGDYKAFHNYYRVLVQALFVASMRRRSTASTSTR